jgi:hypothetical protein
MSEENTQTDLIIPAQIKLYYDLYVHARKCRKTRAAAHRRSRLRRAQALYDARSALDRARKFRHRFGSSAAPAFPANGRWI